MQLMIAYAFDSEPAPGDVERRLERVRQLYAEVGFEALVHGGTDLGALGVHLWDSPDSPCRWPLWHEGARFTTATLYPPVGYEAVVGPLDPADAVEPLSAALDADQRHAANMPGPYGCAILDREQRRLVLVNDVYGLARMFATRFDGGWVWSNRISAAKVFAGTPADPDPQGWRYFAASSYFMDMTTPLAGVAVLPPGTKVEARGDRWLSRTSNDPYAALASPGGPDPVTEDAPARVAEQFKEIARSISRLWEGTPVVDLSGGKDSRLVAASFIAADLPVILNTNGGLAGEATVARDLVARIGRPVEHRVSEAKAGTTAKDAANAPSEPLVSRILRSHVIYDGFRGSTYLPQVPPTTLATVDHLVVGGLAGELAHTKYYLADALELESLPMRERVATYSRRLGAMATGLLPATHPQALEDVRHRVDVVVRAIVQSGHTNATISNLFYMTERMRRWGGGADRAGIVAALLAPEFARVGLRMSPEDHVNAVLHRAVIRELMPQWGDIEFYKAGTEDMVAVPRPRVWDEPDRDAMAALLDQPERWGDAWHPADVRPLWEKCLSGKGTPRDELVFQRIAWRATWDMHSDRMDAINGVTRAANVALPPSIAPAKPVPSRAPAAAKPLPGRLVALARDPQRLGKVVRKRAGRYARRVESVVRR